MTLTPLEAALLAGAGSTVVALITVYFTRKSVDGKYITKEACAACATRQWVEDIKQVLRDTHYLKQVVRLLAEGRKMTQGELVDLENRSNGIPI